MILPLLLVVKKLRITTIHIRISTGIFASTRARITGSSLPLLPLLLRGGHWRHDPQRGGGKHGECVVQLKVPQCGGEREECHGGGGG